MTSQAAISGVAQDIFQPVDGLNPSYIPTRPDHPVPRTGIVSSFIPQHESRSNLVLFRLPNPCQFRPTNSMRISSLEIRIKALGLIHIQLPGVKEPVMPIVLGLRLHISTQIRKSLAMLAAVSLEIPLGSSSAPLESNPLYSLRRN